MGEFFEEFFFCHKFYINKKKSFKFQLYTSDHHSATNWLPLLSHVWTRVSSAQFQHIDEEYHEIEYT